MSADFDPRILWTRRDVIAAGTAGAASMALGGAAEACAPGNADALFVAGAGAGLDMAAARRMAHLAHARLVTIPEETDIVRFWSRTVEPNLRAGAPVIGLTGWADYMVLRGMAAERRLRVRVETGPGLAAGAEGDSVLAARLRAALDSAPGTMTGRIGWVLA